jgi:hypothetical protein
MSSRSTWSSDGQSSDTTAGPIRSLSALNAIELEEIMRRIRKSIGTN